MKVVAGEYLRIKKGSYERVYIYDDGTEKVVTITMPFFEKLKKKGVIIKGEIKEEEIKEIKEEANRIGNDIYGKDIYDNYESNIIDKTTNIVKHPPQKSLSTFFEEKEENIKPAGIIVNQKISDQKSLLPFFGEKTEEKIVIEKFEKKRQSGQIETDYYEQSRIETCANRLKGIFNVIIEILPVRYGTKPPINEKIRGYYMLIKIRDGADKENITEFINKECNIKVY